MNSILKQELLELKGSINYWLALGWIIAIFISIFAITIVLFNRGRESKVENIESSNKQEKSKGF